MKLKFYARDDLLVTVPGSRPVRGQAPEYVGRKFVPGTAESGASHPATVEGFECEAGGEIAARLVQLTRRDAALWPADKATADACGVPFVEVTVKDGVAAPKPAEKKGS